MYQERADNGKAANKNSSTAKSIFHADISNASAEKHTPHATTDSHSRPLSGRRNSASFPVSPTGMSTDRLLQNQPTSTERLSQRGTNQLCSVQNDLHDRREPSHLSDFLESVPRESSYQNGCSEKRMAVVEKGKEGTGVNLGFAEDKSSGKDRSQLEESNMHLEHDSDLSISLLSMIENVSDLGKTNLSGIETENAQHSSKKKEDTWRKPDPLSLIAAHEQQLLELQEQVIFPCSLQIRFIIYASSWLMIFN